YRFDCRALLRCFPTMVDVEDPLIRWRDANEPPYHLGVGNRVPSEFVATATRTLRSRRASGRGLSAQTARRDSGSPPRHLSTPPQLSNQPQFDANQFDHSGSYAHDRIFRSCRSRDACALETRYPPCCFLLANC